MRLGQYSDNLNTLKTRTLSLSFVKFELSKFHCSIVTSVAIVAYLAVLICNKMWHYVQYCMELLLFKANVEANDDARDT